MRSILFSVLLLGLPLQAMAETREERLTVAEDYVTLALQDFDMAAVIDTMWAPIVQQVEAAGQTVSSEQRDKIRALYMETFEAPMTGLMKEQATIMADVMTLAEITALRDFYKTPEGRSVMVKLPQLMQAQQPGVMKLVNETMPVVMPKVLAIINGEGQ
ncbi:MAG: DUF2059 domain-containing protein [Tabrizicola sp.]|nr:DUF2059 domain-containing protein [Tabrizicola sp.]